VREPSPRRGGSARATLHEDPHPCGMGRDCWTSRLFDDDNRDSPSQKLTPVYKGHGAEITGKQELLLNLKVNLIEFV
jgi:hypothetical protein